MVDASLTEVNTYREEANKPVVIMVKILERYERSGCQLVEIENERPVIMMVVPRESPVS